MSNLELDASLTEDGLDLNLSWQDAESLEKCGRVCWLRMVGVAEYFVKIVTGLKELILIEPELENSERLKRVEQVPLV